MITWRWYYNVPSSSVSWGGGYNQLNILFTTATSILTPLPLPNIYLSLPKLILLFEKYVLKYARQTLYADENHETTYWFKYFFLLDLSAKHIGENGNLILKCHDKVPEFLMWCAKTTDNRQLPQKVGKMSTVERILETTLISGVCCLYIFPCSAEMAWVVWKSSWQCLKVCWSSILI